MNLGNLAKSNLEAFVLKASDAVDLKLIKKIEDLDNDEIVFHPEFTHQIFGDTEMIFGYKGLKIKMYYTASKLRLYFNVDYQDKVDPKETDGIEADDVLNAVKTKLELQNYFTNPDKFVQCLQDESSFQPYGKKLHEFIHEDSCFEIYYVNHETKDFIQDYHEQMQHFLLWFIDGASYIDTDDERWDFFVIYERVKSSNNYQYHFVGYSSVYRYYAYPDNIRPRISQVLVLPPFQRKNVGFNLLKTINNYYISVPKAIDITVEDPSDNFCQLRNHVDCLNCVNLVSFSPENLKKGWTKDKEEEARDIYKIHKQQARKVYEILKLKHTNINNPEEYKKYRLEVKARLAAPLLKNKKSKFVPQKQEVETIPKEAIIEELASAYKELEAEYLKTINRINLEV